MDRGRLSHDCSSWIFLRLGQQAKVIAWMGRKGQIEDEVVKAAITEGKRHYERNKKTTRITLPLTDRNGDPVAALRVEIKSFAGQTRANALTRAIPALLN